MPKVYSKALKKTLDIDRYLGKLKGGQPGPCLVFFAGIHGNEPSGIFALNQVFEELQKSGYPFKGTIIGLAGNLWALERGERYQYKDLNRLWNRAHIYQLEANTFQPKNEDEKQMLAIQHIIRTIRQEESGPFYFFDLHTTSGDTIPFITVNDSLLNRKFTNQYPIPTILGIEEYLEGPLLSYLNQLGYVSFGFEAGQHDSLDSIQNHLAFIWMSLGFAGSLNKQLPVIQKHLNGWKNSYSDKHRFYEIFERYQIKDQENFKMEPGFENFQLIESGQLLAKSDKQPILARINSRIFMPLYQSQGNDGYFLIRPVPVLFLKLSALLRKLKLDQVLTWLPGVNWNVSNRTELKVDLKIARFFARPFFHLLGYRARFEGENFLILQNREMSSRSKEYQQAEW
jgi:hypothetical protein